VTVMGYGNPPRSTHLHPHHHPQIAKMHSNGQRCAEAAATLASLISQDNSKQHLTVSPITPASTPPPPPATVSPSSFKTSVISPKNENTGVDLSSHPTLSNAKGNEPTIDSSNMMATTIPSPSSQLQKKPNGGTSKSRLFLPSLYQMVNNDDAVHRSCISWSSDGKTFWVSNVEEFSRMILPMYFRHNNYASFVRQLNMYGFQRSTETKGKVEQGTSMVELFSHEFFVKGQEHLLQNIHRKTSTYAKTHVPTKTNDSISSQKLEHLEAMLTHQDTMFQKMMGDLTALRSTVCELEREVVQSRSDSSSHRTRSLDGADPNWANLNNRKRSRTNDYVPQDARSATDTTSNEEDDVYGDNDHFANHSQPQHQQPQPHQQQQLQDMQSNLNLNSMGKKLRNLQHQQQQYQTDSHQCHQINDLQETIDSLRQTITITNQQPIQEYSFHHQSSKFLLK